MKREAPVTAFALLLEVTMEEASTAVYLAYPIRYVYKEPGP